MAPRRRTIIPPTDNAASGGGFEFEPSGIPIVDTFREQGDMQLLQDATFNDWTWTVYRLRTPDEMRAAGTRTVRVFVTKTVGPFDVLALQQLAGGGAYEIRGQFEGRMLIRHELEIEGPRRVFTDPPAPPRGPFLQSNPPVQPTAMPQHDVASSLDARRLDRIEYMLEMITRQPPTPPAPAPAPATSLADVIALADHLNKRELPTPTGETVKELMSVLKMGMELAGGQGGGAGPETTMGERMLEKALPTLERVALGLFTARMGGRARPMTPPAAPAAPGSSLPTPPPVPSSATVVESPPVATPATQGDHRWPAAIEALANAITRGDDPAEFTDTLELLLPADELRQLAALPDDAVIGQLRIAAGGMFPVLESDEAAAFVAGVLAAIRNPDFEPTAGV